MQGSRSFRSLLRDALEHFSTVGYTNEADLSEWLLRLSAALDREQPTDQEEREALAALLDVIFRREVQRGGVLRRVPGVDRYTLDRVSPALRAELDRRIFAGVDLIRLNRRAAKEKTLQRFAGWVTSMPPGGPARANVRQIAREITKPTAEVKFQRRRVAIDQGHKLNAAVAHVVANQNGAIAAIWHDRGERDRLYDARPEHLARTGQLFLVRDSWAMNDGLIKKGSRPYTDSFEQPAELPFCSCFYEYITSPRALPPEYLTKKGREWLEGGAALMRADATLHYDPEDAARDVERNPTRAQIEAGNYAKGHVKIHGLDITLENPKGGIRSGIDPNGQPWFVKMPAHYGYIRRTVGADDEQLDCYIGPNPESERVWVVDQIDLKTKQFDEHKVLIGFRTEAEALGTYHRGFSDGHGFERIGRVTALPMALFREQFGV